MSTSSDAVIALEPDQISMLQSYVSGSKPDWPRAYRYVQSIVQQKIDGNAGGNNTDLQILANWLGNAASINADDGSWKSEFVRGETETFSALLVYVSGHFPVVAATTWDTDRMLPAVLKVVYPTAARKSQAREARYRKAARESSHSSRRRFTTKTKRAKPSGVV